ncbi:MAG TPA: NHL repeat-containing protein, partial [Armatimonadota bacterium]
MFHANRALSRRLFCIAALSAILALVIPTPAYSWATGQPARVVLGQPDFSASGNATPAVLSYPSDAVVDPVSGKLFVSDTDNGRVLRFANPAAAVGLVNAEAVLGQANFRDTLGETTQNRMTSPQGLAIDQSGRLWVADFYNCRILRFDNAAAKPSGADADGVLGQPDFTSRSCEITRSHMQGPTGLAVDGSGRLWVSDRYSDSSRVLRFDDAANKPNGADADGVLGQPDFTSTIKDTTQNRFYGPRGIAVDGSGRLWVADGSNHRVLRFDNAAGKENGADADGVLGQLNFTSSTNSATQSGMYCPVGLAVDSSGRLWVADSYHHRVLRFDHAAGKADGADADGVLGQADFSGDGQGLAQDRMNSPVGLTADGSGRLWVIDQNNNRALRFDSAASKPDGGDADGVLGQPDFTSQDSTAASDSFYSPTSIAVDPVSGKLFVADRENNRVLRFAHPAALASGAPAEAVLGQPDFIQNGLDTGADRMRNPGALTVDSSGRLWVADTGNNRVLRFDDAAQLTSGAGADGVLGQADFTNSASGVTRKKMNTPMGLAVDGGRLWVADYYNNRVLRFDTAAGKPNGADADGVLGQLDYVSDWYATTRCNMSGPMALAVDGTGRLWVTDSGNGRVLRFDS